MGKYTCETISVPTLATVAITAQQCLGPNPRRKAIMLSPVVGAGLSTYSALAAQVFGAGSSQSWTVPARVTQVVDIYGWGSGGNAGAAGVALGGGGGGSGSFATSGPLTVVPGSVFSIAVDNAGGAGNTIVTNPSGTVIVQAGSGANGVTSNRGAAGSAVTGVIKQSAGASVTASDAKGGAAGGAGGNNATGSAGAGQVGGAGGGGAVLLTYGQGGNGGNGGIANANGSPGTSPGGGGGGGGSTTGTAGAGADGQAVVFYTLSDLAQVISISQDQSTLAVGTGSLNYFPGATFPIVITDDEIGDEIITPWFMIGGVAGTLVRITEYLYVNEDDYKHRT